MKKDRLEKVADAFLALGYEEGTVIEHSVFWRLFELQEPKGYGDAKVFNKQWLRFGSDMDALKNELLRRGHDLQNVRTKGYWLVPFHDRPKEAYDDGMRIVKKGINSTLSRLDNIPGHEQLTGEAKRIRDNGLTKFGYLKALLKAREMKKNGGGTPPAEQPAY